MTKKNYFNFLVILVILILSITVTASAFQVKLNDRGRDVIEIQKYLETLGYNVSADGIFGKSCEDAVKEFQKKNNLAVDGIVGTESYQLIKKMISEKISYELYIVKNGDTLSGIANSHNVKVKEIRNYNKLSSEKIKPGQDLKIPRDKIITVEKKTEAKENQQNKAKIYYTVNRGDTLSGIAARRNLPVEEIMDANNLNSDFINVGDELVLPITNFTEKSNSTTNKTNRSQSEDKNDSEEIVHTVQRGDALSKIAKMYGTDVDSIRSNNNINGDRIFAGDELLIKNYSRGPFSLGRNSFIWPVNGRIASNFGWRNHPIKKTKLFHNGLDIAVPRGTSVKAAAEGEVVYSGWMNGFGYTVIIDHGRGVETLYGHNSKTTIAKGSMVAKGQQVALSGNTGLSTGPHLHFGVLKNENPLNPRDYLP